MSRENFVLKLTGIDNTPRYVMVHNIFAMTEMPADTAKKIPEHTHVSSVEGFGVQVIEKPVEIERKASAFGVMRILA